MRNLMRAVLALLLAVPVFCALAIVFALSGRRRLPLPEESPQSRSLEGGASGGARPHTALTHNGGRS
jgi:hypothetical protein